MPSNTTRASFVSEQRSTSNTLFEVRIQPTSESNCAGYATLLMCVAAGATAGYFFVGDLGARWAEEHAFSEDPYFEEKAFRIPAALALGSVAGQFSRFAHFIFLAFQTRRERDLPVSFETSSILRAPSLTRESWYQVRSLVRDFNSNPAAQSTPWKSLAMAFGTEMLNSGKYIALAMVLPVYILFRSTMEESAEQQGCGDLYYSSVFLTTGLMALCEFKKDHKDLHSLFDETIYIQQREEEQNYRYGAC